MLIVNTASKCGFTPQYHDMEELYQKYKDSNFTVLAFPCDQFFNQEFSSVKEILRFTKKKYKISFPLFQPIKVNGKQTHPLYKDLKVKAPGIIGTKLIKWNFTKFLIDAKGNIIHRYAPKTPINKIAKDIEKLLKQH